MPYKDKEKDKARHRLRYKLNPAIGKRQYECAKKRILKIRTNDPIRFRKMQERTNELGRIRKRKLRYEVLQFYGGKCVCCGECHLEFLAVDHKNNDGKQHRKIIKGKLIYQWAREHNYPNILQILCHNCNLAKGFYGKCPHGSLDKINN